jgi:hypothetical protein
MLQVKLRETKTNSGEQFIMYKVVQIWPGQTVTCLHTISPGHIWTTLYIQHTRFNWNLISTERVQT